MSKSVQINVFGRWPKRFLKSQMRKLMIELVKYQRQNITAVEGLIKQANVSSTASDPADFAVVLAEIELQGALANRFFWPIVSISRAIETIKRDLKSGHRQRHEYGRCIDCGSAVRSGRLVAISWADCCVSCQEKKETEMAACA